MYQRTIVFFVLFASAFLLHAQGVSAATPEQANDLGALRQQYKDAQMCSTVLGIVSGLKGLDAGGRDTYNKLAVQVRLAASNLSDQLGITPKQFAADATAYSKRLPSEDQLTADFKYCMKVLKTTNILRTAQ